MTKQKISAKMISLLVEVFIELYPTKPDIAELFANVLDEDVYDILSILHGDETHIVIKRLFRFINEENKKPLDALSTLLEEVMEEEIFPWGDSYKQEKNRTKRFYRTAIKKVLAKENFFYQPRVGVIKKADVASILFLQGDVSKSQFPSVVNEITRAKGNIKEKKYREALLNSGSMLEAACKLYLKHKNIIFKNKSSLYSLWEKTKVNLKNNTTHENIAEGLFVIIEGVRKERNQESTAHGRTEEETKQGRVYARSAKLVVRSAITLSFYILDHLEI